jgi:hypothetical protein
MTRSSTLAIGAFVVSLVAVVPIASGQVLPGHEAKVGEGAVLRVQIVGRAGTTDGTCFLVHQERREHDVVHYFLTSSHLFDAGALGESRTVSLRIRVIVDGSTVIETGGNNVLFPGGIEEGLGLAIIKAVSTNTRLAPTPVAMDPPDAGGVFVIWRRQGDGSKMVLTERVRFRSTRLVIGDRAAADANGFLGSPAAVEGRVFGVVSEVGSGGAPVIALLSAARGFLTRAIPGWTPTASTTPGFRLEQRRTHLTMRQRDGVTFGGLPLPADQRRARATRAGLKPSQSPRDAFHRSRECIRSFGRA